MSTPRGVAFSSEFGALADSAARQTGLDRWVILAQWALESAFGTSAIARECHNLAGLKDTYYGRCGTSAFGTFPSLQAFVDLYAWEIEHAGWPPGSGTYYAGVRATAGKPATVQMAALGASPWSAEHYGSPPGVNLHAYYAELPVPAPAPAPSPAPPPPPAPAPAPAPPPEPVPVQNPPTPPEPQPSPPDPSPVDVPPIDAPPPELPEPPIVAEAGVSTSEWAALVRYGAQLAGVGTAALINDLSQSIWHVGVTIPASTQLFIGGLELAGALAVGTYAISRGIRKLGAL